MSVGVEPMELRRKILKDQERVPFVQRTAEYGVAWFNFCPIWRTVKRRKRVVGLSIYPRQQPNAEFFYEVGEVSCEAFSVDSWTHRGIPSPRVWQHVWCPEHRTISICAYVPSETDCFMVSILPSCLSVYFDNSWQDRE